MSWRKTVTVSKKITKFENKIVNKYNYKNMSESLKRDIAINMDFQLRIKKIITEKGFEKSKSINNVWNISLKKLWTTIVWDTNVDLIKILWELYPEFWSARTTTTRVEFKELLIDKLWNIVGK